RADLVFLLQLLRGLVYAIDLGAAADFEAPVIVEMRRLQRIAGLHRDDMELGAAAHEDRRLALAHAFEAEKFLIEFPRLGEVVALQRAVREHRRLDHRSLVARLEDRVLDRSDVVHFNLPRTRAMISRSGSEFRRG